MRHFARSALECADVGFVVFRAVRHEGAVDWEVVDANAYVRGRWVPDAGTANGHRMSTHADAITRDEIGPILEAALTSGSQVETDHEVRMPSGAAAWRRVIVVPVDHDVVAVMTYDIGELVGARGRAAALSQHTSDIVAITHAEGGLSWVSPAVEAMLGYPAEELVGRCTADLVHPDDVGSVIEHFVAVSEDASDVPTVELRLRRSDGEYRWFQCAIANRLDDPDVRGVVLSMHDIDARRHSEDALRMSELRMRSILETAADAIITSDDTGTILEFNQAAERIFRLSASDVIGGRYTDLLPESAENKMWARKTLGAAPNSAQPIEVVSRARRR